MNLYVDERGYAQVHIKSFGFDKYDDAQIFAEHLYATVPHAYKELNLDSLLTVFNSVAEQYHALYVKPLVTEEQRKSIVQANSKNEKKEYKEALELYKKAIDVNPTSYRSAYCNMALIAAQTKDYQYAILNMKKYLMLVPEAEDARAAKDKIYEWEAELSNLNL
jgi:tetratricopeptide (TPR) repeat protein